MLNFYLQFRCLQGSGPPENRPDGAISGQIRRVRGRPLAGSRRRQEREENCHITVYHCGLIGPIPQADFFEGCANPFGGCGGGPTRLHGQSAARNDGDIRVYSAELRAPWGFPRTCTRVHEKIPYPYRHIHIFLYCYKIRGYSVYSGHLS